MKFYLKNVLSTAARLLTLLVWKGKKGFHAETGIYLFQNIKQGNKQYAIGYPTAEMNGISLGLKWHNYIHLTKLHIKKCDI